MKIRPASIETDLQYLSKLCSVCEKNKSLTIEKEVRSWLEYEPAGRIFRCLVALDENDSIIGYSAITHEEWAPASLFYVFIGVDPSHRRLGIGSALWKAALDFIKVQKGTLLTSEIMDDNPDGLDFAERRGFAIDRQKFASSLYLTTFDETPYLPVISTLKAQGIRFGTLAEFPDTHEMRRRLYELNNTCAQDMPGSDGDLWSFPEFEKFVIEAPYFAREGQFLALDGELWVGLAGVTLRPETQSAYNEYTGVLRAYRGRKIGQALKVLAARYACEHGALRIETHNDSQNTSMLAINKKMGYRPEPGKYKLVCSLDEPAHQCDKKEEIHE